MSSAEKSYTISLLTPDLRGGGVERIRLTLAKEFGRLGYDVEFVLAQARGDLLEEARREFPVIDLRCRRFRSLPFVLNRYLRRRRPDALLAAMWPLSAIAPIAACSTGVRVLVSEHGILSAQYTDWGKAHRVALRATTAIGYRKAHARVGVSKGVVQDMAQLSGMNPERFAVINNPIASSSQPTNEALATAERTWTKPRGARLLTVGTFKKVKNQELLIRSFSALENPEAELLILGDGELKKMLVSLCNELGVSDRVTFAGFHSDPTPYYQTADVFVLSSNFEGFGNVIVEALASGLPVVSTDCPSGPAEILGNGRWGRLSPVGDVARLASEIEKAFSDPKDVAKLKLRAADFTPAIAAQQYLNALGLS